MWLLTRLTNKIQYIIYTYYTLLYANIIWAKEEGREITTLQQSQYRNLGLILTK